MHASQSKAQSAIMIDGKAIAQNLKNQIKEEASNLPFQPGLGVILVGEDPASQVYVRNKVRACEAAGIHSVECHLPKTSTQAEIAAEIDALNKNKNIHGILLQLPLPAHLDSNALIQRISPEKDVDGLTYINQGKLLAGDESGMVPCTPQGSLDLIHTVQKDLTGLHAVVIGRSLLFGKPMGQLLLSENCTVTHAHSRTKDLESLCQDADILIAAVGRKKMVKGSWVKPGAIVIDVGINRMENGKLCGDVDTEAALSIAKAITPVPGGVGPMTIACLLKNTLIAAQRAGGK